MLIDVLFMCLTIEKQTKLVVQRSKDWTVYVQLSNDWTVHVQLLDD